LRLGLGLVWTCASVGALGACEEKERATRSEAAAVSRAIDAVRTADNAQKSGPLGALRAVPCSAPEVCAVQSHCVAAYEKHVAVLGLLADAKATSATAPPEGLVATLAKAERDLAEARTLTDDCATRQGELLRRFHVGR
jgi:hypothetical protein